MTYTPVVTFSKYLKDGIETDISSDVVTVTSGSFEGIDEDKFIYNIVVDPMELSRLTVSTHEFKWTINPSSGTENTLTSPVVNGLLSGSAQRFVNFSAGAFIASAWSSGLTSGSMSIALDDGFVGSGSSQAVSVPNSGTAWSPPFGVEGDTVVDVPTIFQGSYMNTVIPPIETTDRLHDFQMVQLHVGHQVEVSNWSEVATGLMEDNDLTLTRGTSESGELLLSLKTFHLFPDQWELYDDDSILVASGTQTGDLTYDPITGEPTFTAEWDFINNLSLGTPVLNEDWTLKLYASGSIAHPTPLRTINIHIVVGVNSRFGIGRFGLARFGL